MTYDRHIPELMIDEEMYRAKMGNGRIEANQTQVAAQCQKLAEESEVLAKQVHVLEERLNAILRPADNIKESMRLNEVQSEPLVQHADFLRTRVNFLEKVSSHLASILQRIEL